MPSQILSGVPYSSSYTLGTVQYSTSISIVRLRSNYGKGSLQYSTVQYCTVQYGSINMQVSTRRDQCTLVASI